MNLKESLEKKRFVVTSEVQVPLGDEEPEVLVESLSQVKGRVDGVSVSEIELEGVVTDTIKTCGLLKDNKLNAIYQLSMPHKVKNPAQAQVKLTQILSGN